MKILTSVLTGKPLCRECLMDNPLQCREAPMAKPLCGECPALTAEPLSRECLVDKPLQCREALTSKPLLGDCLMVKPL